MTDTSMRTAQNIKKIVPSPYLKRHMSDRHLRYVKHLLSGEPPLPSECHVLFEWPLTVNLFINYFYEIMWFVFIFNLFNIGYFFLFQIQVTFHASFFINVYESTSDAINCGTKNTWIKLFWALYFIRLAKRCSLTDYMLFRITEYLFDFTLLKKLFMGIRKFVFCKEQFRAIQRFSTGGSRITFGSQELR